MKLTHDKKARAVYVKLLEGQTYGKNKGIRLTSKVVGNGRVYIDYDRKFNILGVEILY